MKDKAIAFLVVAGLLGYFIGGFYLMHQMNVALKAFILEIMK